MSGPSVTRLFEQAIGQSLTRCAVGRRRIYDSPDMPEADCTFQISNGGVINVDD